MFVVIKKVELGVVDEVIGPFINERQADRYRDLANSIELSGRVEYIVLPMTIPQFTDQIGE